LHFEPFKAVPHGPSVHLQSKKSLVGRASVPAAFGGTGFHPVRRTGKIASATKNFS
jgi:hypothetical protein